MRQKLGRLPGRPHRYPWTLAGSTPVRNPCISPHNGKGGTELGKFYGANRVLDHDAFTVNIVP